MRKPDLKDYNLNQSLIDQYYVEINKIKNKFSSTFVGWSVFILILLSIYIFNKKSTFLNIFEYAVVAFFLNLGILTIAETLLTKFILYNKFGIIYKKIPKYEDDLKKYELWLYRTKLSFWQSLSGRQFERELSNLFEKVGHIVKRTGGSGDKGIDIIIDNSIAVQCKAYKNKVPPAAIRDLLGTLQNSGYKKGILASTNGFTTGVSDYIKNNDIKLMTAEDYVKLQNTL
jgi:HJR/Mrr/RecB family endonuclease